MKYCAKCSRTLPLDNFAFRNKSTGTRVCWCRPCFSEYRKENKEKINARQQVYRDQNRERVRAWDRAKSRRYTLAQYGLTEETFAEMSEAQEGKCLVCGCVPVDTLVVDHCHGTGKVRGLLCRKCNAAIGSLGDDPAILRRAIDYLEGTSV